VLATLSFWIKQRNTYFIVLITYYTNV